MDTVFVLGKYIHTHTHTHIILEKRKQKILKCTIYSNYHWLKFFVSLKHKIKLAYSLLNHQKIYFTHCKWSPFTSPDA